MIKDQISRIQDIIAERDWKVKIAPETAGKHSAFGGLDELLQIRKETGCHLTVDFAHLRARNMGNIDYKEVLDKLKGVEHIHSHFSGIEWTEKGEKRHKLTEKKVIIPFIQELVKRKINMTIINESPDPIHDALKMKQIFLDHIQMRKGL